MEEQKLRQRLEEHQHSLQVLEQEISLLMKQDALRENQALQKQVQQLEQTGRAAQQRMRELEQENLRLKRALSDQLFSERTGLVNRAKEKTETFFRESNTQHLNRLRQLELSVQQRILSTQRALEASQSPRRQALLNDLGAFELRVRQELREARQPYEGAPSAFSAQEQQQLEALKQEPLTEEQVAEISRKNNVELFIGQNLINKAGVLLLIIGIITASRYTLLQLPNLFKGIAIFLLGGLMLAGGELLNRRRANAFSLGITAGGVAVLYVGVAVSYFVLGILGVYPAIGVCVLVTAVSFLLSQRYDSQTIATFAMVGGYLPLLALGNSMTMIYGAMAYFVALNLLALLLGSQKRWRISGFVGFALNLLGSIYLSREALAQLGGRPFGPGHGLLLGYIFFTFLIYTAVPVLGAYRRRENFALADVALLALNTIFSSAILYWAFYGLGLEGLAGLLALIFAASYLLLGRFIEKNFQQEQKASLLFYLTGFAFVVLVIPFQFGRAWLSLGWLAEGVVVLVYGILRKQKLYRQVGAVICGLCLLAFARLDLPFWRDGMFLWKYSAITLGSLFVAAAFLRVEEKNGLVTGVKLGTAINFWFYLLYLSQHLVNMAQPGQSLWLLADRLQACLWVGLTVLLAYGLSHHKKLVEQALDIFSLVLYGIACFGTVLALAWPGRLLLFGPITGGQMVLATGALVLVSLLAVFALRQLLLQLVLGRHASPALYPLLLSGFGLLVLTQALVVQYGLLFTSVLISLVYMGTAVAWVVLGFARRSASLRRFGLGLSVAAVVKLFLLDLYSLTTGYRIVSYFALGIALILISFLYQYFVKRLDAKGVEHSEAPKE